MPELTFLGTNGSIQEKGSGNTSLFFRSNDSSILIDVSSNIWKAVEEDTDAVIVTHSHTDHVYGLPSLLHQLWLKGRKKPLYIYAPKSICPLLENLVSLFSLREKKGFFELVITEAVPFTAGSISVRPFKTDHTDDSIGLLLEAEGKKVLYTSDTRPIKEYRDEWMNPDLLVHEASGSSDNEGILIKKGHSSGKDAAVMAAEINASRLILCHLPSEGKEKVLKEAESFFPRTILPSELSGYTV